MSQPCAIEPTSTPSISVSPAAFFLKLPPIHRDSHSMNRSNILANRSNCRRGLKSVAQKLKRSSCRLNCHTCEESKQMPDPHANMPVVHGGHDLSGARCALILLHGRGSSADNILGLAKTFYDERIAFIAPQAANNTW